MRTRLSRLSAWPRIPCFPRSLLAPPRLSRIPCLLVSSMESPALTGSARRRSELDGPGLASGRGSGRKHRKLDAGPQEDIEAQRGAARDLLRAKLWSFSAAEAEGAADLRLRCARAEASRCALMLRVLLGGDGVLGEDWLRRKKQDRVKSEEEFRKAHGAETAAVVAALRMRHLVASRVESMCGPGGVLSPGGGGGAGGDSGGASRFARRSNAILDTVRSDCWAHGAFLFPRGSGDAMGEGALGLPEGWLAEERRLFVLAKSLVGERGKEGSDCDPLLTHTLLDSAVSNSDAPPACGAWLWSRRFKDASPDSPDEADATLAFREARRSAAAHVVDSSDLLRPRTEEERRRVAKARETDPKRLAVEAEGAGACDVRGELRAEVDAGAARVQAALMRACERRISAAEDALARLEAAVRAGAGEGKKEGETEPASPLHALVRALERCEPVASQAAKRFALFCVTFGVCCANADDYRDSEVRVRVDRPSGTGADGADGADGANRVSARSAVDGDRSGRADGSLFRCGMGWDVFGALPGSAFLEPQAVPGQLWVGPSQHPHSPTAGPPPATAPPPSPVRAPPQLPLRAALCGEEADEEEAGGDGEEAREASSVAFVTLRSGSLGFQPDFLRVRLLRALFALESFPDAVDNPDACVPESPTRIPRVRSPPASGLD